MPAHPSYNTYNKELTVLRKGHALYHPEPVNGRPVEIGDVGFIVAGSFQFLFSATGGADDPVQVHGVPEGFVPLELSPEALDIRETGIQAGPLHGRTVVSNPTAWDQASASAVLPANTEFSFECNPTCGAILALETTARQAEITQHGLVESYVRRNCLSWYDLARRHRLEYHFGDLMLVTETSKTAAWSIAVYSGTSGRFALPFSRSDSFPQTRTIASGYETRRNETPGDRTNIDHLHRLPKDHAVFIKGFRVGIVALYKRSLAHSFVREMNSKYPMRRLKYIFRHVLGTSRFAQEPRSASTLPNGPVKLLSDFHPAVALLALAMSKATNEEFVIVHDNEWCTGPKNDEIIQLYSKFYFSMEGWAIRGQHLREKVSRWRAFVRSIDDIPQHDTEEPKNRHSGGPKLSEKAATKREA